MRSRGILHALSWALLVAVALLIGPVARQLPAVNGNLAADAYGGWAGVLRVWVCGGWAPGGGSFIPWLNGCAARFERRHPGVYVQMQSVSADAIAAFLSGELGPPDAILFAPGMLPSGEGLSPLAAPPALREALTDVGLWQGELRALPVALGGYAWVLNQSLVQAVPHDWSTLPAPAPVKKQPRYLMQVPADQPYLNWSGALNALCAPRQVGVEPSPAPRAGQGIDLGLPIASEPTPVPPEPATQTVLCRLPALLPGDFRAGASAYEAFLSGKVAAIPATQREIRRLQLLSDAGRAPNWSVAGGGGAFSDQLLMAGVPDGADEAERRALARAWVDWLLRDDSQAALTGIRALRVTTGDALYAGQMGMAELEQAMGGRLEAPNAFDTRWREREAAEADRLVRESRVG